MCREVLTYDVLSVASDWKSLQLNTLFPHTSVAVCRVVNLDESTGRRVASNLLNVYYFEVLNLVRSTTVYVYDSIR